MTARAEKIAVACALAASFLLFNLYSLATPLFEASDELWHYPFVQHLAGGGGLPIQRAGQTDADAPWRQEGSQPPVYYALAALATAPFDDSNWRELRRLNPHADLGFYIRDGNANAVLHSPAEQFPWSRAALAVRVARLVSAILSTLTVFFAYWVGKELFPPSIHSSPQAERDKAWLRLGTMAFVACVPMFAFISGSVNNDNAAVLFSTLGVWWALRMVRLSDTSPKSALIAGLIASAGALSKTSALGLVGLFVLAAALVEWRRRTIDNSRPSSVVRRLSSFLAILFATTALLAGWWFARNQFLYGEALGWNAFLDAVGRRDAPATLAQLWTEREGFARTYWGVFGALNVVMPAWIYDALNGMAALAVIGGVWAGIRRATDDRRQTPIVGRPFLRLSNSLAAFLLSAAWVIILFVALLRWTSLTPATQGRLMFPAIAVIAAGISYGLFKLHRAVLWGAGALLIAIAIAAPLAIIRPAYMRPPALTEINPSQRLDTTFGDRVELLGYDAPARSAQPGDEISLQLYWRLPLPADRNYSVFVHLVDENGVIIAQRDMYPGQGLIATGETEPGYAWTDRYTARIPASALAPTSLRWQVGVYDPFTGQRLPITRGAGSGDAAQFGSLELTGRSPGAAAVLDYHNGITLSDYQVEPRSAFAGEAVTVTLVWRATDQVDQDYTVSLQLLDDQANKAAQQDGAPVGGTAPTSSWRAGSVITDTHILNVAPTAAPGVYRLQLVLYDPEDFKRLGAYGADGQFAGDQVALTRIGVR